LCLAVLLALQGAAQNTPVGPIGPRGNLPQPINQRAGDSIFGIGTGDPIEEEERLRALNKERHKSLVSDTNKLLKLAGELDVEIKNGGVESLTPTQLRKWAEIEKLAHNVKDKMVYSVRGFSIQPPPISNTR
jgi:hypothetical protein